MLASNLSCWTLAGNLISLLTADLKEGGSR